MLGGLARWLRAAGYDASWQAGIDDWDLVRQARREDRVLLTSDTGIVRLGILRDGEVASLFIPHGLKKHGQLAFVLEQLHLDLQEPRCMACGGPLMPVPREEVGEEIPARTREWIETFYRCGRCGKLFWTGTHWQRIERILRQAREGAEKHG